MYNEALEIGGGNLKDDFTIDEHKAGVLRFNLTEGKNREIRNICTLFNLKVEKLKRISYGRFLLKSITYGNYKEMQVDESYKR